MPGSGQNTMCDALRRPACTAEAGDPDVVMAVLPSEADPGMVVQQVCWTVHARPTPLNATANAATLRLVVIDAGFVARVAEQLLALRRPAWRPVP